jgi:hypothetical protein
MPHPFRLYTRSAFSPDQVIGLLHNIVWYSSSSVSRQTAETPDLVCIR